MNSQSLEYIVKTHFPLIKDKFNFSMGSLRGISFTFNVAGYSPQMSIYPPISLSGKTTTYKTKEVALEKYKKIVKEHLSEYIDSIHFDLLYNKLIENVIPRIEKSLESRKNAINKLCVFTHARFKKMEKDEYTRLFKDGTNELCRITYSSADKARCKPRFVSVKHKNKNQSIAVTLVNIPAIMEDIETNLIINEEQKRVILEQLNFLVGPTEGYGKPIEEKINTVTITQDLLQSIEDELERALNRQVKDKRINWKLLPELTTQEKWEHYGDHETYQTWLKVHTIRNKK